MADVRCYSRRFITEFIKLYESVPCLWKRNSKDYSNRQLKSACYQKLIDKLRQVEPKANRDFVIKKINSLRTSRRKEWKKFKDAEQLGEVYKPVLWYYDLLSFIDEREARPQTTSSSDQSTASCFDGVMIEKVEPAFSSEDNVSETNSRLSRTSVEYQDVEYDQYPSTSFVSSALEDHPRPPKRGAVNSTRQLKEGHIEDRFDIFGKNVAMKMRDLKTQQRLIAEKIINDTLFKAEIGTLRLSDALEHKSAD